jgi:predicted transcriptional regulator
LLMRTRRTLRTTDWIARRGNKKTSKGISG